MRVFEFWIERFTTAGRNHDTLLVFCTGHQVKAASMSLIQGWDEVKSLF